MKYSIITASLDEDSLHRWKVIPNKSEWLRRKLKEPTNETELSYQTIISAVKQAIQEEREY